VIRVAIDSNILIYAKIEPDTAKGMRSADLILRTARDGVIPAQALGEFLRFVQRRFPISFEEAIRQASLYQSVFITPPTTDAIINKLTEDMQDGRNLDGLRLMNPFVAANAKLIDDLLADDMASRLQRAASAGRDHAHAG
jgi:predicted nucleic acid-binding protein